MNFSHKWSLFYNLDSLEVEMKPKGILKQALNIFQVLHTSLFLFNVTYFGLFVISKLKTENDGRVWTTNTLLYRNTTPLEISTPWLLIGSLT